ncbi:arylsulfatase [Xylariomycetidae sp. FL0641]|nr:arylsulfatase [Xylariomycetidae sp. FL0641]
MKSLAWSLLAAALGAVGTLAKQPNIVLIMTDDQDLVMDSVKHQKRLLEMIGGNGVTVTNHYTTVSQCCPSRGAMLRGQAAHNTNLTNVDAPGGNYDKWVLLGEDKDYLPYWLRSAGYKTEYIGKLLNGVTIFNYNKPAPRGWDNIDVLLDPYTYEFNNVVMSENGARPLSYPGYHQSDVIRAKALARLDYLTSLDQPFYLQLAPTSPHDQSQTGLPPTPLARYADDFADLEAPRNPNFNTADQSQQDKKPSWWKALPVLNETQIATGDDHYRHRVRSLLGIDDIIEDVVNKLAETGELENTYVIYTTDNGFHIGQHRDLGGKTSPYREDTNLPMYVRGPNIPAGSVSTIPSTHIDLAPTFLSIAGLSEDEWPPYLDGTSLLPQWEGTTSAAAAAAAGREILNVEYWGGSRLEAPGWVFEEGSRDNNSYKTLRIVDEAQSWLYSRWCTGDTELYNTTADPWELENLAGSSAPELQRVQQRLNALLMATKSCAGATCRNPWTAFDASPLPGVTSLAQALNASYDAYFGGFATVSFLACLQVQATWNEQPFFPPASVALQGAFREPVDTYETVGVRGMLLVPNNTAPAGGWEQRHVGLETIMKAARVLTDYELGVTNVSSRAVAATGLTM